jgi:hypothetical protein
LETALLAVIAAEPLEQKIRGYRKSSASGSLQEDDLVSCLEQGLISQSDADLVERARALRRQAIMVDDFPQDLGKSEIYQTTQAVSFGASKRERSSANTAGTNARHS